MKFFHVPTFLISLAIGLFFVYINNPNKDTIYVFPTPENIKQLLYRDKSDHCFKFDAQEVKCPTNTDLINNYDVQ